MKNRGIIIAGTGTGVGKTIVTSIILTGARQRGINAVPMNPVQTGALVMEETGDRMIPDLDFACRVIGLTPDQQTRSRMAPFVYAPACSPHLAAKLEDREYPDLQHICECMEALLDNAHAVVIETAGGILVPLNERDNNLDLMLKLGFSVVLVADAGLGTINHTLMSIRTIRDSGLELVGVILCETQPVEDPDILRDNPDAITRHGEVEILGRLPYAPHIDPDDHRFWLKLTGMITGLDSIMETLANE